MADEDFKTFEGSFDTIYEAFDMVRMNRHIPMSDDDYSALIKAAEDILKIAGAR